MAAYTGYCGCPSCYPHYQRHIMEQEIAYRVAREVEYEMRRMMMPRMQYYYETSIMGMDVAKPTDTVECIGKWQSVAMREQGYWETRAWNQQYISYSETSAWNKEAIKQLMAGEPKKESNNMGGIVKRIKALGLNKADKLLRKYQIVDNAGDLTSDGKEALLNLLFEQNKTALVAKLTEVEANEKQSKK